MTPLPFQAVSIRPQSEKRQDPRSKAASRSTFSASSRPWRARLAWTLALCVFAHVACSSDDESAAVTADEQAYDDACSETCAAQTATGCALVDRETCQAWCDQVRATTSEECLPLQAARMRCEAASGYACSELNLAIPANPGACRAETEAADASCRIECVGADSSGACPAVDCDCPGISLRISGASTVNGECRCLTQQTCVTAC